jgi:hypothetical protein
MRRPRPRASSATPLPAEASALLPEWRDEEVRQDIQGGHGLVTDNDFGVQPQRAGNGPSVGFSSWSIIFATVDLPEPDSPTIAIVVPRRTSKVTPSAAAKSDDCPGPAEACAPSAGPGSAGRCRRQVPPLRGPRRSPGITVAMPAGPGASPTRSTRRPVDPRSS